MYWPVSYTVACTITIILQDSLPWSSEIWANQPIHSFFVGCLNPCFQETSVRVGSPHPSSVLYRKKLYAMNSVWYQLSSLISRKSRDRMFPAWTSLLVVTFSSLISWVLTLKWTITEFQPHARMHHVVIIAMLISCYFIMSHATLIIFYHASMWTLHNSLTSRALWLPQAWYYGVWGQIR